MRGFVRKRTRKTKRGTTTTRWHAVVYAGKNPETGTKLYPESKGFETKREADAELAVMLTNLTNGPTFAPSDITTQEYLRRNWLPTAKARVKPTTWRNYAWMAERYLIPLIGQRRLADLTTADVNTVYARLLSGELPVAPKRTRHEPAKVKPGDVATSTARTNRSLSAKTVRNAHLLLRKVLADAVDEGLIARNPADRAKPPRPVTPEIAAWSAQELQAFLSSVADERDGPMWRTIALTGLRRGELLGLRWQDIDFENNKLMVRQNLVLVGAMETAITKPKNHQSRVVDIDERTMDALRQQRKSVSEQQLAFGPGYHRSDLVFPRFDGRPMNPDTVSKRFGTLRDRLIRSSALTTRISLHGLRHTHASLLLADGIHVKVVSERLGHASTAFTMAVYQHTLPSMQREAAAAIAALVDGPGLAAVGSGI